MNITIEETLTGIANQLRIDSIAATTAAGSGHPTSCCSAADLVAALFFGHMRYDPKNPRYANNDRFILSKGHAAPLLYAAWAELGLFPREHLNTLRELSSDLEGHPTPRLSFVDVATGSLGQGLAVGVGMALCARLDNLDYRTYVLMGDGEQQEGQVWEAAMYAAYNKMDHVIATIDYNGQQIDGPVDKILSLLDLKAKWESFGWIVNEFDGNKIEDVIKGLELAKSQTGKGKPVMNLMKTVMGFGVDYMMGSHKWHGVAPNDEELKKALDQLEETIGDY